MASGTCGCCRYSKKAAIERKKNEMAASALALPCPSTPPCSSHFTPPWSAAPAPCYQPTYFHVLPWSVVLSEVSALPA